MNGASLFYATLYNINMYHRIDSQDHSRCLYNCRLTTQRVQ